MAVNQAYREPYYLGRQLNSSSAIYHYCSVKNCNSQSTVTLHSTGSIDSTYEPRHENTCGMPYVNNKGTDQPEHWSGSYHPRIIWWESDEQSSKIGKLLFWLVNWRILFRKCPFCIIKVVEWGIVKVTSAFDNVALISVKQYECRNFHVLHFMPPTSSIRHAFWCMPCRMNCVC